jgi:hypothetical protein
MTSDGGHRCSVEEGRPDRVHAASKTLRQHGGWKRDDAMNIRKITLIIANVPFDRRISVNRR